MDEDGWVHVEEGIGGGGGGSATNGTGEEEMARMQILPLDSEDKKVNGGSDNGGVLSKKGVGEEGRAAEAASSAHSV